MKKITYPMTIAGVKRKLPVCKLNDNLAIGAFVLFGDVKLTEACAGALLKKAPEFDYMVAPEAKAIPLIYEMARQSGRNTYLLVRKNKKAYMQGVFEVAVNSITTEGTQYLYMDGADAKKMKGKRILIIDDVISTGESLRAVEMLVNKAGGIVVGRMAVLAEGDAIKRDDIIYLEPLPLFNPDGTVKEL
ncbi:MAG: adenine phosphoribosyltransferase [Clostridia bacterium]|nr:adenine phosphoribosyltransferase [Clostridia bacterium]